jgi:hypothetical protein
MPVFAKVCALALASLSLSPAIPQAGMINDITLPSPFRASFEVVPFVACSTGTGSGVRISDDIVVTATHVASLAPCSVDGHQMAVVHNEQGIDFSAMQGRLGIGYRATVSCEGIVAGERYMALGYANGGKANMEPLLGTNQRGPNHTAMVRGRVYHGMSGGAVMTSDGAVVAITVMMHKQTDWAYVVPLSETYLCRA